MLDSSLLITTTPPSSTINPRCHHCGVNCRDCCGGRIKQCSNCKLYFCSVTCFNRDAAEHQEFCRSELSSKQVRKLNTDHMVKETIQCVPCPSEFLNANEDDRGGGRRRSRPTKTICTRKSDVSSITHSLSDDDDNSICSIAFSDLSIDRSDISSITLSDCFSSAPDNDDDEDSSLHGSDHSRQEAKLGSAHTQTTEPISDGSDPATTTQPVAHDSKRRSMLQLPPCPTTSERNSFHSRGRSASFRTLDDSEHDPNPQLRPPARTFSGDLDGGNKTPQPPPRRLVSRDAHRSPMARGISGEEEREGSTRIRISVRLMRSSDKNNPAAALDSAEIQKTLSSMALSEKQKEALARGREGAREILSNNYNRSRSRSRSGSLKSGDDSMHSGVGAPVRRGVRRSNKNDDLNMSIRSIASSLYVAEESENRRAGPRRRGDELALSTRSMRSMASSLFVAGDDVAKARKELTTSMRSAQTSTSLYNLGDSDSSGDPFAGGEGQGESALGRSDEFQASVRSFGSCGQDIVVEGEEGEEESTVKDAPDEKDTSGNAAATRTENNSDRSNGRVIPPVIFDLLSDPPSPGRTPPRERADDSERSDSSRYRRIDIPQLLPQQGNDPAEGDSIEDATFPGEVRRKESSNSSRQRRSFEQRRPMAPPETDTDDSSSSSESESLRYTYPHPGVRHPIRKGNISPKSPNVVGRRSQSHESGPYSAMEQENARDKRVGTSASAARGRAPRSGIAVNVRKFDGEKPSRKLNTPLRSAVNGPSISRRSSLDYTTESRTRPTISRRASLEYAQNSYRTTSADGISDSDNGGHTSTEDSSSIHRHTVSCPVLQDPAKNPMRRPHDRNTPEWARKAQQRLNKGYSESDAYDTGNTSDQRPSRSEGASRRNDIARRNRDYKWEKPAWAQKPLRFNANGETERELSPAGIWDDAYDRSRERSTSPAPPTGGRESKHSRPKRGGYSWEKPSWAVKTPLRSSQERVSSESLTTDEDDNNTFATGSECRDTGHDVSSQHLNKSVSNALPHGVTSDRVKKVYKWEKPEWALKAPLKSRKDVPT